MVLRFDSLCRDALQKGADMDKLFTIPARERIGRAKTVDVAVFEEEYSAIEEQMKREIEEVIAGGEDA